MGRGDWPKKEKGEENREGRVCWAGGEEGSPAGRKGADCWEELNERKENEKEKREKGKGKRKIKNFSLSRKLGKA